MTCFPCAPGSEATGQGSPLCTPCGDGQFAPFEGTITCRDCPSGTRSQNRTNSSSCVACEVGTYAPLEGLTACLDCELGRAASEGSELMVLIRPFHTSSQEAKTSVILVILAPLQTILGWLPALLAEQGNLAYLLTRSLPAALLVGLCDFTGRELVPSTALCATQVSSIGSREPVLACDVHPEPLLMLLGCPSVTNVS